MEVDLFAQRCIEWFAIWLGLTIWALIALQFRKEKEPKNREYPSPTDKQIKQFWENYNKPVIIEKPVYITPKKVEVRRIAQ
jgi:hypothetical protein